MAETTTSLIPPESFALVGEPLGDAVSATITAKDAQRYARAADDLNPVYFDEAAAKAAGYRTIIAPPTYLLYATARDGTVADLRPDGLYRGGGRNVPLLVKRVMFGGQEFDFIEPACVGDTVAAQNRLKSLEQKEGSSGPFVLMVTETTYTNQDGTVIARARGKSIAR